MICEEIEMEGCQLLAYGVSDDFRDMLNHRERRQLQEAVKPLIETNKQEKDWHPGSDRKVLNLVHPSLYSLVYGRKEYYRTVH